MLVIGGSFQAVLVALALVQGAPGEIAYVGPHGLTASGADGSNPRVLAAKGTEPAWSPDGTRLAYVHDDGEETSHLVRLGGGDITPLRKGTVDASPAWSPDGAQLAFARFSTVGDDIRSQIIARNLATGAEAVVAETRLSKGFSSVSAPTWSPSGSLVYTYAALDRHAYFKPQIRTAAGAVLLRDAESIAFSPDGRRIAYGGTKDHADTRCGSDECAYAAQLYVANADGSGATRLTRDKGAIDRPQWAPDSSRIVFGSDRNLPEGDSTEVYSIAPDGSCFTWLTNGRGSGQPTFRPHSGERFDPGSCDPNARRPTLEPLSSEPYRGNLWLGSSYRGLLLSRVSRGALGYEDCEHFDPCPTPVDLFSNPSCNTAEWQNIAEFKLFRRRGALVAFYNSRANSHVYSGRTVTTIQERVNNSIARTKRLVDALRPLGTEARAPLPAPRVPRSVKLPARLGHFPPC